MSSIVIVTGPLFTTQSWMGGGGRVGGDEGRGRTT